MATLFRENGIDFERVNYFKSPLDGAAVESLARKTGLRPYELLRKGEAVVKELGLTADTPDAEVVQAIARNPAILQRPIVEVGDRAVMARPIDKALELIKEAK
ncbi:MAG: ArsC/Spx/MgsR family protein [Pyrinomonadaceae bacterium]